MADRAVRSRIATWQAMGIAVMSLGLGAGFGPTPADALAQLDIVGPAGSEEFGRAALVLPNGNFVVIDSKFDGPAGADIGAVYLYNGATNALISRLTGSTAGDSVGREGVTVLSNGNFVVKSTGWDNGAEINAGAATFVDGVAGFDGVVSASNSIVGSSGGDEVGTEVVALTNGNYVVVSQNWGTGVIDAVGAVTWGNGTTGSFGPVSAANSLVGSKPDDQVGYREVEPLSNGNYIVTSPFWDKSPLVDAGAATWGNGTGGTVGPVSAVNSLTGGFSDARVGESGSVALTNGNYVIVTPTWTDGATAELGAVTWGNGATGTAGVVSDANSLVGSTDSDRVGDEGVTALTNGNYVVASPYWDNGLLGDVGAATWGNGAVGTAGAVSTSNSIYGPRDGDLVAWNGVTALANGNYVVASPTWSANASDPTVGAATWGNGAIGTTGAVSASNSLTGTVAGDQVGESVTALTNGNYVVASVYWHNGSVVRAGAATWGNGATGISGPVSGTNSLVGSTTDDAVAIGVTALTNGNYVVSSPLWNNGSVLRVGAVTWGNGATGVMGPVTVANSLIGSAGDIVSSGVFGIGGITALANGNYVVASPYWRNGSVAGAGAATWGNGASGTTGVVSASNSLVGAAISDGVSSGGVTAFADGSYAVSSPTWQQGSPSVVVGAVTYGPPTGVVGPVVTTIAAANSVIGTPPGGIGEVASLLTSNNSFVVATDQERVILLRVPYLVPVYKSLTPGRLVDTRPGATTVDGLLAGGGRRTAGSTLTVPVAGRGGVAATAVTATLNIVAVDPTGAGFLTVYPCDVPQPVASTLNYSAGTNVANASVSKLSATGTVCIYTSSAAQLIVDTTGFHPAGTTYQSLKPTRFADTRVGATTVDGVLAGGGRRPAGSTLTVPIAGRSPISAAATTATLNIVAADPSGPGFLTVYPCDQPRPNASTLNYNRDNVANMAINKLSATGTVCIYTEVATDLIVDIGGSHFDAQGYTPLSPARLADTRPGGATTDGLLAGGGQRTGGSTMTVQVAGRGGVLSGSTTATLNIVAVDPTGPGFLTVYPCDATKPNASTLNYDRNNVANAALAKLSATGTVCIYTEQPVQLIVDVGGYYQT